jgi:hypothetical protein
MNLMIRQLDARFGASSDADQLLALHDQGAHLANVPSVQWGRPKGGW